MSETTLTINHADGGSETYVINREEFEGVRNMFRKLAEIAGDPQNITGFTVSGITYETDMNGTYSKIGTSNGKGVWRLFDANIVWMSSGYWRYRYDGDTFFYSYEDTAYPWDVTTWTEVEGSGTPTFGSFVGGSIGGITLENIYVDRTPDVENRIMTVDGAQISVNNYFPDE